MSTLVALLKVKKACLKAYHEHVKPAGLTPEQEVAFDIEEKQLWNDYHVALEAYNKALATAAEMQQATKPGDAA